VVVGPALQTGEDGEVDPRLQVVRYVFPFAALSADSFAVEYHRTARTS